MRSADGQFCARVKCLSANVQPLDYNHTSMIMTITTERMLEFGIACYLRAAQGDDERVQATARRHAAANLLCTAIKKSPSAQDYALNARIRAAQMRPRHVN